MKIEPILYKCDICGAQGTEEMIFFDVPNDKYVCYRKECVEKHAAPPEEKPYRVSGLPR